MNAIYKKEMKAYLVSPIGYVFIAVFFAISGYYFMSYHLFNGLTDFSYLFSVLFSYVIFITPLLTMRILSEEKKNRTDQCLITAPVPLTSIVLAKFFAALTMFLIAESITFVYFIVISFASTPDIGIFLSSFLSILLLGAAMCAIGVFASSITENQIIAAVVGIIFGMIFMMIDSLASLVSNEIMSEIISSFSFYSHSYDLKSGIINIADIIFFLSITTLFVFLTVRVLEKRRIGG